MSTPITTNTLPDMTTLTQSLRARQTADKAPLSSQNPKTPLRNRGNFGLMAATARAASVAAASEDTATGAVSAASLMSEAATLSVVAGIPIVPTTPVVARIPIVPRIPVISLVPLVPLVSGVAMAPVGPIGSIGPIASTMPAPELNRQAKSGAPSVVGRGPHRPCHGQGCDQTARR